MTTVETRLGPLAYRRGGTPGPFGPILLLHGMGMSMTSYDDVRPDLEAAAEVIAIDFPGHGTSPARPGSLSVLDLADAIADAIDRLGLPPLNIIGNSLGAMTAVELAATYPDKVRRLVLVGCPGWDGRARATMLATAEERFRQAIESPPATVESLAAIFTAPTERLVERVNEARRQSRDSLVQAGLAVYGHDTLGRAFSIRAPTLLLVGDRDIVLPEQQRFLRAIPDVGFALIENAGHYPQVDDPARFVQTVLTFLTEGKSTPVS
ncbi:MAG: alpha/beta hydrolase [Dehalococcoidia bacterium]|nr:MAG: alpha/beta hydrolase [Dehalococcoidia bacterium]